MDVEESVQLLMSMGFPSESEIRRALKLAKDDINEAVELLTTGQTTGTYEEYVSQPETQDAPMTVDDEDFPATNLYELESRVMTSQWSIPYRDDESLAKCMFATIKLFESNQAWNNELCCQFLNKSFLESFRKLLDSQPVNRWNSEIQEGVYDMIIIMIDVVAHSLVAVHRGDDTAVPGRLVEVLALSFCSATEFHKKNKHTRKKCENWETLLGEDKMISQPLKGSKEYYWLSNIINKFMYLNGFDMLADIITYPKTSIQDMAALTEPIANAAEMLIPRVARPLLEKSVKVILGTIERLGPDDFRNKNIGRACDLLRNVKIICKYIWASDENSTDDKRLDLVLRMLKSTHFNAKMNALIEISKMLEDSTATDHPGRGTIPLTMLTQWMSNNEVLSIILSGSIDQAQYCEKVKKIVQNAGPHLSEQDLDRLWNTVGHATSVVDNVHSIFAAAASHFSLTQFSHFSTLILNNWKEEKEQMQEKLITLFGDIGIDTKSHELASKIIDVLWELSHHANISRQLLDRCLVQMYKVLTESTVIKESTKKKYVEKCVENIRKGFWVLPAITQLIEITKFIVKSSNKADKVRFISELHRSNTEITKLIVNSLLVTHHKTSKQITPDTRYTHHETVEIHLQCLQLVLQESGGQLLSWKLVKELWECLIVNSETGAWEQGLCFEWLSKQISDLETDAAHNLFIKKLTQLNPSHITEPGLSCWKTYFTQLNIREAKLRRGYTTSVTVEKTDLVGLDVLWTFCLNITDNDIADQAVRFLLENIYINLSGQYKRDISVIHKHFIEECRERLEALMISMRAKHSAVYTSLSQALYTLTAVAIPGLEQLPAPMKPKYLQNVERLLLIVERYVMTVEDTFQGQRSLLPHGASFYGTPLSLVCECETRKNEDPFTIRTHRNATLLGFKNQIADHMKVLPEKVVLTNIPLKSSKDQRLLCQLELTHNQKVTFRLTAMCSTSTSSSMALVPVTSPSSLTSVPESSAVSQAATSMSASAAVASPVKCGSWENEKCLPGVLMSADGQVYKLLYQLAALDESRITSRIVNLLHLIPTDPSVLTSVSPAGSVDSLSDSRSPSATTSPTSTLKRNLKREGSMTSLESGRSEASRLCSMLFNYQQTGSGDRPEISPFRLKYNLEVLSARLVPVDMSTHSSQFTEDFITNNGIQLISQLFKDDFFNHDVDKSVQQTCYMISLQIIQHLLAVGVDNSWHPLILHRIDSTQLSELISSMMRVAWASSVGKLNLSAPAVNQANSRDIDRTRVNSTESTTSSNGDSEVSLQSGICILHNELSDIHTNISIQSLNIITQCILIKPESLDIFYSLPHISDFIIDILTGCCREEVRSNAASCFTKISNVTTSGNSESARHFLLKIILSARLPYWISNSSTRGFRQRLLIQCLDYFNLRCSLLSKISTHDQKLLNIDVCRMLEDEIAWLNNFQPTVSSSSLVNNDDLLLTGHLRLIRTLLTAENINKDDYTSLINTILDDYLFSASKLQCTVENGPNLHDISPKCRVNISQTAAYDLLLELCSHCVNNYKCLTQTLISYHHTDVETSEWEYLPTVDGRANAGYVGLKNGGATCYMNSVLQQMFMIPGVPESLLSVDDEMNGDQINEQKLVFHEVQQLFGHLLDSQLQYFEPDELWRVFKLWGQSVNIREQQDAYDFFTALTDQLDETLKQLQHKPLFEYKLKGMYSDLKICDGCPHKYEREEPFLALNLTVSDPSLEQSLHQFVKGERLEGDNSYLCEKCNVKRSAIKRMCIKSLPPVLCIHLKRFSYDWEANKALKFDDFFQFPMVLDMSPYMLEDTKPNTFRYELVGIVVHTGQATAGHYYSYIKERRGSPLNNSNHGRWFKFNDTTVEEFTMNEETLTTECFGGKYKANVTETGNTKLPEDRVRYWNAYLLFYERIPAKSTTTPGGSHRRSSRIKNMRRSAGGSPAARQESLVELSDLVQQSESQGMFSSRMTARVQRSVRTNNLKFLRNRNLYSQQYFNFIRELVSDCQLSNETTPEDLDMRVTLASHFILNTYLHTKETLRKDTSLWFGWFKLVFVNQADVSQKFINYCASDPHKYIIPYLLTCAIKDVREFYFSILKQATVELVNFLLEQSAVLSPLDDLLDVLLNLLQREVVENARNSYEYFLYFNHFSRMDSITCDKLMSHDALSLFINFLVGQLPEQPTLATVPRRSIICNTRDLEPLHSTIAILILHLRIPKENGDCLLTVLEHEPEPLFSLGEDFNKLVFTDPNYSPFYIREALYAVQNLDSTHNDITIDSLVYVAHCIQNFSDQLIAQLSPLLAATPGNEVKGLVKLAAQIMMLSDSYQSTRLNQLINDTQFGAINIIKESTTLESLRSYLLIKLLTDTAKKSDAVSQHLINCSTEWQWCVDWLKRKMSENSWTSFSTTSNQDTVSRNFLRTASAQFVLDAATAMLPAYEGSSSDMDIDSLNEDHNPNSDADLAFSRD